MLSRVEVVRKRSFDLFTPDHSALLVLDVQNFFLDSSSHAFIPSIKAVLSNIKSVIYEYYRAGHLIVFTRHLNTNNNAHMMAKWWRDIITIDNPLSEISDEIDISTGVIVLKNQYDAFYDTNLMDILTGSNVNQLVICGVMTHLCCETTARSAFMRGLEVFFTIDGTATYNEQFHMASLRNLSHGFATPSLVSEIVGAVRGTIER